MNPKNQWHATWALQLRCNAVFNLKFRKVTVLHWSFRLYFNKILFIEWNQWRKNNLPGWTLITTKATSQLDIAWVSAISNVYLWSACWKYLISPYFFHTFFLHLFVILFLCGFKCMCNLMYEGGFDTSQCWLISEF